MMSIRAIEKYHHYLFVVSQSCSKYMFEVRVFVALAFWTGIFFQATIGELMNAYRPHRAADLRNTDTGDSRNSALCGG
jgi:hypothetical protein